jgi:hypothetical protein
MIYDNDMSNFLQKYLFCCFKSKHSLNIELVNTSNNLETNIPYSPNNTLKNLVNSVISLSSFTNKLNNENICKICNKEFNNEDKICDCLAKDELHPNYKETELKIREKYIHNTNVIEEAIHIDKNPDKLILLVKDIYDIVEKSSLKKDLTPKTLEKIEQNLINEICVHIEDYITKEE